MEHSLPLGMHGKRRFLHPMLWSIGASCATKPAGPRVLAALDPLLEARVVIPIGDHYTLAGFQTASRVITVGDGRFATTSGPVVRYCCECETST